MSDRTDVDTVDHPLREVFLAHLGPEERDALIPAFDLLQSALFEYERHPGPIPIHERVCAGAAADVAYAAREIESLLDSWGEAERTGTRELRSAATAAADHLRAAHELLTGAVRQPGDDDGES
jgi:hypothetical protein